MNPALGSLKRISAMVFKELKQLSRDRMTFAMIVMIPLVQLMLFGYAINTDVRHVPAGIVDHSGSAAGRALIQAVEASQVVRFTESFNTLDEAEAAITEGKLRAVLYLPADFTERISRYRQSFNLPARAQDANDIPTLGQWLVDGSDTMIAAAIRGLRNLPLDEVLERPWVNRQQSFAVVQYFNPQQRTAVNIVPGLLAIILSMTMIVFTAVAIVREHEEGNMEFLITTPVHPLEIMIGKITPFVAVGLIQTTIILSLGHWLFGVPVNGGLLSLLGVTLLFIAACLVLGLVISTIATTQMQAMQMTFFLLLPSILLSGFMFPYEAMPKAAQWIAEVLPATHFMRLVRGVVLRGAEVQQLIPDSLWLASFAVIGLLIATRRFRKRLD